MTEIHAHNVLNLLREKPMSEAELRQAVNQEFGEHAMFRTCKLNGFDLDALLTFFIQKQKIVQHDSKWSVNMGRVCGH
ncbi:YecH family metal-binding protein [Vibrio sp. 16]|uniref:YecH family metal-binding protein n=1 Tax=Vibrio sp. 16 TaxID=391586 RepID=UPI0012FCDD3D|nr:YecH family metal-binding protein [Vibrio sp. 16]CAK4070011.1 hypothetical protein VDT1_2161 [Vibrio sp. 16]